MSIYNYFKKEEEGSMSGQSNYPPMEWFHIPELEVFKYIVAVVLGVVVCAWLLRQGKDNSVGCVVVAMIIVVGIFVFVFTKIPGEIVGIVLIALIGGYIF